MTRQNILFFAGGLLLGGLITLAAIPEKDSQEAVEQVALEDSSEFSAKDFVRHAWKANGHAGEPPPGWDPLDPEYIKQMKLTAPAREWTCEETEKKKQSHDFFEWYFDYKLYSNPPAALGANMPCHEVSLDVDDWLRGDDASIDRVVFGEDRGTRHWVCGEKESTRIWCKIKYLGSEK